MPISKKTRFEVFKRDFFTCQYCGIMAPDVILEVDHIDPKSKGGKDDILNLVTSCFDCNRGKSNKKISESDVVKKKQKQLKELEQKRQQLEMLHKWQIELLNIDEVAVQNIAEYWSKIATGYYLNDSGLHSLKTLRKKFSDQEIMSAMKTSTEAYLKYENDKVIKSSVEDAFSKVGGICTVTRRQKDDPDLKKVYYLRGILRNRGYINDKIFWILINEAREKDIDLDDCIKLAKCSRNWSSWRNSVQEYNDTH